MSANKIQTILLHGGGHTRFFHSVLKDTIGDRSILFIPYARPSGITYKQYTDSVSKSFKDKFEISGIEEYKNPKEAVRNAEAIYVGGGNTFVLITALYKYGLLEEIKRKVKNGTPYIGVSAGANVAGKTIMTTNDMPIAYPPSFKAIGLVPFIINPHYPKFIPAKAIGETREVRIREYLAFNKGFVVALNEGTMLQIIGNRVKVKGIGKVSIFKRNKKPIIYKQGANMSFLLK